MEFDPTLSGTSFGWICKLFILSEGVVILLTWHWLRSCAWSAFFCCLVVFSPPLGRARHSQNAQFTFDAVQYIHPLSILLSGENLFTSPALLNPWTRRLFFLDTLLLEPESCMKYDLDLLGDRKSETAHHHYTTTLSPRLDFDHTLPLTVMSLKSIWYRSIEETVP